MEQQAKKYHARDLSQFASTILQHKGMEAEKAAVVAQTLLESDLMGHPTHGLALLHPYYHAIDRGDINLKGHYEVLQDSGTSALWDGKHLPGAWLVHQAIDTALERIKTHPIVTLVIKESHHIGCLAAYPERATEKGLVMLLACSDPAYNRVAPFGGVTGAYSPNPIAGGFPTEGDPVIFDISTSATAGGVIGKALREDKKLSHPWLITQEGKISNDPETFSGDTPSNILPLGGMDTGYKGFALGIMVDALTLALGGHGRADQPKGWETSVFLQIIDPAFFGGKEGFTREMQYLKNQCLAATPIDEQNPVRMPGERALKMRAEQQKNGLILAHSICVELEKLSKKTGIPLPNVL